MTTVLISFKEQPWHDDWFLEVCSWCVQTCAELYKKSNRISLRPRPGRERMCLTHVTLCVRLHVCTYHNCSNQHGRGRGMFPVVQLLIQLECVCVSVCIFVCVCVWEVVDTEHCLGGCKEAVNGVKRLTEGTAWPEPFPWDSAVTTEFMLTTRVLTCS